MHLVDDLADGGNGDLGKFLVAADGINGAHDIGESLLAHYLHDAVDPAVALEAVHQPSVCQVEKSFSNMMKLTCI